VHITPNSSVAMLTRSAVSRLDMSDDVAGQQLELAPVVDPAKQAEPTAGPSSRPDAASYKSGSFRHSSRNRQSFIRTTSGRIKRGDLHSRINYAREARAKTTRTSRGNPPADPIQRQVMLMVYTEITAYPPEGWCGIIGRLINRDPGQVSIWFGNQRQREARARCQVDAFVKPPYHNCASGRIRMQSSALEYFPETDWSDELLEEIVLIEHVRRQCLLSWNGDARLSERRTL